MKPALICFIGRMARGRRLKFAYCVWISGIVKTGFAEPSDVAVKVVCACSWRPVAELSAVTFRVSALLIGA